MALEYPTPPGDIDALIADDHAVVERQLPHLEAGPGDRRTMSVAADGHRYVTADQLYRQDHHRGGTDERRKPCVLFRTPIDAGPVRLR